MRSVSTTILTAPMKTQQRGQTGEDAAAAFLKKSGYRIVERNWRPGNSVRGELDCIAWHGKTLCFVEVKARTTQVKGAPQEAVTPAKQRQISRLANAYVSMNRIVDVPCRFDVVEVWLPANEKEAPRIALCRNAFDYCGDF